MTSSNDKKISTRFYPALDILLLKQIYAERPMGDTKKWESVTKHLNEALGLIRPDGLVTVRGCKDRFRKLISAYKSEELVSLRASGTDEEYGERERLLCEIKDLEADLEKKKEESTKAEQRKIEQGETVRQKALQSLAGRSNDEGTSQTPPIKRRKKFDSADYVNYLKEKSEKEFDLRQQQLNFDRERFELERQERKAKTEHDSQMMELMLKLANRKEL